MVFASAKALTTHAHVFLGLLIIIYIEVELFLYQNTVFP